MNGKTMDQRPPVWINIHRKIMQETTEKILNFIITQDAVTRRKLHPFQGALIKVHCTAPDFTYYIQVDSDNILTHGSTDSLATMGVQGTLADLTALIVWLGKPQVLTTNPSAGQKANKTKLSFPKQIILTGEKERLLSMLLIIKECDTDWEGWLAEKTHLLLAHAAGQGIKKTLNYLNQQVSHGTLNIVEYLQEESGVLVPSPLFSCLQSEVTDLDKQLNLLDQRVSELEKTVNSKK